MPSRLQPRRRLDEFQLIHALHHRFGRTRRSVHGIGDDAAIVRLSPRRELLVTTDLLVERVHFNFVGATFEDVGYKAAVANLSDIAAMGGTPEYMVSAIAIPASHTHAEIMRLYRGMMLACRSYGVELIGGDTSASQRDLFLCITMTGSVRAGRALRRDGARVGDLLYVTGTLGDSLAGFDLLTRSRTERPIGRSVRLPLQARGVRYLIGRHLRPTPRIQEAQWLSENRVATAAIDLSDGLSGDLVHLCERSGVGAEIDALKLPLSKACAAYAAVRHLDAAHVALTGGEDYELLFTVSPKHTAILDHLANRRGMRCSRIGIIRPHSFGRRIRTKTGVMRPLPVLSYRHFHNI